MTKLYFINIKILNIYLLSLYLFIKILDITQYCHTIKAIQFVVLCVWGGMRARVGVSKRLCPVVTLLTTVLYCKQENWISISKPLYSDIYKEFFCSVFSLVSEYPRISFTNSYEYIILINYNQLWVWICINITQIKVKYKHKK